jgi:hypothetical protein
MTDTPTPETNATINSMSGVLEGFPSLADLARRLERERDELRKRVGELEVALYRFEIEDVTLSEGDEMDLCVTFEDQQILRAALAKTKEAK